MLSRERRSGDRVVGLLVAMPADGASHRTFGNSIYPTLPLTFGGDSKSRRSVLSGVYARGTKTSHTGG